MSIEAIAWAKGLALPPRDKFVLVALADHHNVAEHACWPKHETLSAWTGYGRRTIVTALHDLEHKHGVIASIDRRYPDGRNASKIYVLEMDAAAWAAEHDEDPPASRVQEMHTDRVHEMHSDGVQEMHSKNLELRSVNLERSSKTRDSDAQAKNGSAAKPSSNGLASKAQGARREGGEIRSGITRDMCRDVLEQWNLFRGDLPAAVKLNSSREKRIRTLIRDLGHHDAIAAMALAAKQVSVNDFWLKNAFGIDNLLAGQKVVTYAEKAVALGGDDPRKTRAKRYLDALEGL